ncbi:MAG: sigma-70 family RNA polymerase sigma factor [Verrucomicrobiota bacterium JB023]|nr:sigma-70 family RNA polymerase sigma factor [Verrucomicrobiota bacterium JB023]
MNEHTDLLLTRPSMIQRAASCPKHEIWSDFLTFYEPFINSILRKMRFREPDLEDVRQQVFLKLWKQLSNYRKEDQKTKFRSWLATVIRNVAIDWLRQQKGKDVQFASEEAAQNLHLCQPEIVTMIEREWQNHVVATAIERLKPVFSGKAFEVLRLSLAGVSTEEISTRLDIRQESVYVLKSRVKSRVQQEVAQIRLEQEGGYESQ